MTSDVPLNEEGAQDQLEDALAELVPQQQEEGLILSPVSELDVLEIRLEWVDHVRDFLEGRQKQSLASWPTAFLRWLRSMPKLSSEFVPLPIGLNVLDSMQFHIFEPHL